MAQTASSPLAPSSYPPSSPGTGLTGSFDRLLKRPHPLRERRYAYADGDVSAHSIFTVHGAAALDPLEGAL
jgi:hypothetical protein